MKRLKHSFDDLLNSATSIPSSSDIEQIIQSTTPRRERQVPNFDQSLTAPYNTDTSKLPSSDQGKFSSPIFCIDTLTALDYSTLSVDVEKIIMDTEIYSEAEILYLVRCLYSIRQFSLSERLLKKFLESTAQGSSPISAIECVEEKEPTSTQLLTLRLWVIYISLFNYSASTDLKLLVEKTRRTTLRKSVGSTNLIEFSTLLDCMNVIISDEKGNKSENPFICDQ